MYISNRLKIWKKICERCEWTEFGMFMSDLVQYKKDERRYAMKSYQKKEIELVQHSHIRKMKFFIVDLRYRGMHIHNDIEILMLLNGKTHIRTADDEFDACIGDLVLFNSNQPHACYSVDEKTRALVLQIDPSFCQAYYPSIRNVVFQDSKLDTIVSEENMKELRRICFNIGYNYFGQKPAYEFRCMSDVNRLFAYLISFVPHKVFTDEEYMSLRSFEKRMERIVNYVQNHYAEKITLKQIAEQEGLTISYLSHFFKDNLNQSFQTYLNSLRFQHALYLIHKTDMRLIDICMQSGFSDTKYLNKMFREVYDMTPQEYRAASQGIHVPQAALDAKGALTEEYIFPFEEGVAILRKYHTYACDTNIHANTVLPE